jgi:predicted PurR-regulated permease PerM
VALLVCSGILIANQLVAQVRLLIQELPTIFDSTIKFLQTQVPWIGSIIPLQSLQTELDSFATGLLQSETVSSAITSDNILTVVSRTIGAFGTVAGLLLQIFTTVMVSLYLVGRRESAHKRLLPFLDKPSAAKFDRIMDRIEVSLGSWVNGQLLLSLIIGVLTYVVMMIPGLFDPSYTLDNFALTVAIIAAIFELLPNIGPTITLILTSILAIGTGGVGGLIYIFITFLAIQNLEATFIVPAVMRRAVDLDPILTILSIIAGFQLAGIMGAVLAVPIVTIVKIIVTELVEMRDTE